MPTALESCANPSQQSIQRVRRSRQFLVGLHHASTVRKRSVATKAAQIESVQQHRVGGDQLIAFEAVKVKSRCGRERRLRQLRTNGLQPVHRTAVVF